MRIFAIDPGPKESAWVLWDGARILSSGKERNSDLRLRVGLVSHRLPLPDICAIEMIASYGMAVGREVFETCVWIGRFLERWDCDPHARLVYRRDVKLHLCGSMRAKDPNVRQALLDRFGGRAAAVGKKAAPGPLYGVSGDVWSALAVAITAAETEAPAKEAA